MTQLLRDMGLDQSPRWLTAILMLPLLLGSCGVQPVPVSEEVVEPAPTVEEPVPAPAPVDPYAGVYEEALETAGSAAKFSESAVSLDDWSLAESRWERAIQALEQIPKEHSNYEQAQSKLVEFKLGLLNAQNRRKPDESLQMALQKRTEAAELTQAAESSWEWQTVATAWEEALNLLKAIPESSSNYQSAQAKIEEYEGNLAYAQTNVGAPPTIVSDTIPLPAMSTDTVKPAREPRTGSCDCPYDRTSNGSRCGRRSAYSRPGGRSPICYVND